MHTHIGRSARPVSRIRDRPHYSRNVMITIATLGMRNWICFKGQQTLKLTPTFYAVVAEEPGDPERSNWHGKSSLLAAIDWALWGRKPEHVRTKGDLITWGEKSMEGALDLSDR